MDLATLQAMMVEVGAPLAHPSGWLESGGAGWWQAGTLQPCDKRRDALLRSPTTADGAQAQAGHAAQAGVLAGLGCSRARSTRRPDRAGWRMLPDGPASGGALPKARSPTCPSASPPLPTHRASWWLS